MSDPFTLGRGRVDNVQPSPHNPSAFPRTYSHDGHNGLTMRDWFAGQVLPTFSAVMNPESAARHAYAHADAMLDARSRVATSTPDVRGMSQAEAEARGLV